MKRTLLCILIVLLVSVLALFASGEQEETASSVKVSAPGVFPIVEEKVSYDALFVDHQFVEDFTTNKLTLYLEELTNVHLNIETIPQGADAISQKLNILFASGEYPDMFLLENLDKAMVSKFGGDNFFIPLNDMIEEHGVNIKDRWTEFPFMRKGITSADGNIYSLPRVEENFQVGFPVRGWLYEPWMKKLGLEKPQTTEDLREILIAFRDEDPNGNGIADEIPMAGAITGWYTFIYPYLMNSFIFCDQRTFLIPQDDGNLEFAANKDEWKEGIKYIKSLYDDGLIVVDSFIQDQKQLRQMGENPNIPILGAATGGWWGNFTINGSESGRYADYITMPALEGPAGVRLTPQYDPQVKPQFFISDLAENPEILVKWADFFLSYEGTMMGYYGFEGIEWRKAEPGEIGVMGMKPIHKIIETFGKLQNDTWHHRAPTFSTKDIIFGEVTENPDDPTSRLTEYSYEDYVPYAKKAISVNLYLNTEDVSEGNETKTQVLETVKNYTIRFITGDLDLEKDWDTYLRELKDAGLDRFIEIYQAAYVPW
jgi:putative aldouronate transport system substrate-binding protein